MKETVEIVKVLYNGASDASAKVVVETVSIQLAYAQMMQDVGIPGTNIITTTPGMQNKGERLGIAGYYMQSGRVYFPESGVDELTSQLINFGHQNHDDLADSFSQLVIHTVGLAKKGWSFPTGNAGYLPALEQLDHFAATPEDAERLRRETEFKADMDAIKDDTERRMRG
jgi:hypothetical protein